MDKNQSLDVFLKRLITAPKARQSNAIQSALALLDGKPEDALLYSGAQTCRMIQVSKPTLWRMVKDGTIQPVHIRGLTRYRRSDLERLAQGEGVPP
jgi:predicted DNA-binding transcriptional regulator AlpA